MKRLFNFAVAFLGIIATGAIAVAGSPVEPALIAEIGDAARSSALQIKKPTLEIQQLTSLAGAQYRAGDTNGARKTIHALTSLLSEAPVNAVTRNDYLNLIKLYVHAGDTDEARNVIKEASARIGPVGVLGTFAIAQIEEGDTANAWKTVETIDAEHAKPSPPSVPETVSTPAKSPDIYNSVLGEIGKSFAKKGDLTHAKILAGKMAHGYPLFELLEEIAKAEHKAGDQNEVKAILEQTPPLAAELWQDPKQLAILESQLFGLCGDIKSARAAIASLPLQENRDLAFSRLSQALAMDGDTLQAREMLDLVSPDFWEANDDYILIGKMEVSNGKLAEARKTFLDAHASLAREKADDMKSNNKIMIQPVLSGLISAGAFSDALSIAKEWDFLNEPFIVELVQEESKEKNVQALQTIAPLALTVLEQAERSPETPNDIKVVAIAFGKAGLITEARSVLAIGQKSVDAMPQWERLLDLNDINDAQISIGDEEGAKATRQKIKEEDDKLNTLLQASSNASPTAANTLSIFDISAGIHEQIRERNLDAAMKTINALPQNWRDRELALLAKAQAGAGQLRPAFVTANASGNPFDRTIYLTVILDAPGDKVQ